MPVALAQNFSHCGPITNNETWGDQDAHIITCDVEVRNSKLTISPNVQILFDEGADLIIRSGAELRVMAKTTADSICTE